ncbi:LacI family DNA-binding transcriptional regulator [Humibacillus xanthopallidus]|uniref:LacI family transcriptional regulator n=1 Tax=Humibacillus xanthopallidus TaxID=412689 RepID=A0A543I2K1_9MICO|nr:LacI family DNA-binding transcriptional regulator [Humibacillus xanthopallidus]TQM64829.1 LacI family transcriptional regulator [Humibacillus xanthopallidus]
MPPRPRLEDVAARARVSTATASLVLRGKPGPGAAAREAVLDAARTIGYRPDAAASLLARRRTQLLGVTMDVSNPFHAELLEEIQAAADARGYDVVVSPLTRTRDERRAVESLLDFRCEGLLLLGPSMTAAELAELGERQAVVAIGRRVTSPGVDVVRAADDVGVGLAVEHLAGLGHRQVVFVEGRPGPITTLRRQGYVRAMGRLPGVAAARTLAGGDTEADGVRGAERLRAELPTAVIAFNDRCALGLLDRLRRDGLDVPRDVSVVGYDDSPVARLATIDLTTVSQAPHAMAEAAVAAAVERLEGHRSEPADVVLEPHLVVRGTTAPPTDRT